ncbi:MAG: quinohemoprotein amine dehydrogenase subunit beta [Burkholderiaceae bacterium]
MKSWIRRLCAVAVAMVAGVASGTAHAAGDRLVTIAKPANLLVFDAAERKLIRDCPLEVNVMPGVLVLSPDGKTAYALVNYWEDVIGVDLESCKRVFYAKQSSGDVRRKSIASLTLSADGKELYTVRNPTRIRPDRYEVMTPEFAVYDTGAGLEAQPVRLFPAPRRSTVMSADQKGQVYIAAADIQRVDPGSGQMEVAIANANWQRPRHSPPDVLAFWPVGSQNNEFLLLYTAALFETEQKEKIADYVWGYQSVDLASGETQLADFASLEVIMFSAVRNPQASQELYGVYTQLSKHDLESKKLIKRVDLPHTYYVINISSDGKEVYVGGTNDDIGVYSTETLERIGEMRTPSGGDMAAATLQVIPGR